MESCNEFFIDNITQLKYHTNHTHITNITQYTAHKSHTYHTNITHTQHTNHTLITQISHTHSTRTTHPDIWGDTGAAAGSLVSSFTLSTLLWGVSRLLALFFHLFRRGMLSFRAGWRRFRSSRRKYTTFSMLCLGLIE